MRAELEKLIDLQEIDTNIRRLKQSIDTSDQRRANIEQEFEGHAFSIRQVQEKRDNAQSETTALEAKIAENKTYLERADRNLKNAQNQKEYETAMRETDALQKQILGFETQIEEIAGALAETENELAERSEEINSLDAKRDEAIKAFEQELKNHKKELTADEKRRDEVFVTLPKNLATVYDRMAQRSRDGIAVAAVINGSCSACFMALRPQMLVEVKQADQIINCESCSRIMYMPRKTEGQSEAQAS